MIIHYCPLQTYERLLSMPQYTWKLRKLMQKLGKKKLTIGNAVIIMFQIKCV